MDKIGDLYSKLKLFMHVCIRIAVTNMIAKQIVVQELGRFMSPPWGGNDIVFFRKVIGYPDHSRMPPFISGELFGLSVENKNYI